MLVYALILVLTAIAVESCCYPDALVYDRVTTINSGTPTVERMFKDYRRNISLLRYSTVMGDNMYEIDDVQNQRQYSLFDGSCNAIPPNEDVNVNMGKPQCMDRLKDAVGTTEGNTATFTRTTSSFTYSVVNTLEDPEGNTCLPQTDSYLSRIPNQTFNSTMQYSNVAQSDFINTPEIQMVLTTCSIPDS